MARLRVLDTAVRANTKNFERGMKRASGVLRRFGGLIAGIAGARALARQAQALDRVAKASDRLGIASEKLIGLHHAAEITGVSIRTFDMAMQRMIRRVAEAAQGTGEARGALKELGLDAEQLVRAAPDEMLRQVADAMVGVENQADKVRLAMKLFDSEGVAMVQTLQVGRSGLDAFQQEMEDMGQTYSREELAKVERMNDNFNRMSKVFRNLGSALVVAVGPLVEVVGHLTGLATATRDVERGILGIERTLIGGGKQPWWAKLIDRLGVTKGLTLPTPTGGQQSIWGEGRTAAIDKRLRELFLMDEKASATGAAAPPPPVLDGVTESLNNLEQTAQGALQTVAGAFDIMSIKARGFGAVVEQVASSLASMASQAFAQHLLSAATGGFIPSPFSVDEARNRK